MSELYDENFRSLQQKNPLAARVIEHCYELCLGYSQYEEETRIRQKAYEEEKEEMLQHLEKLTKKIEKLTKKIDGDVKSKP